MVVFVRQEKLEPQSIFGDMLSNIRCVLCHVHLDIAVCYSRCHTSRTGVLCGQCEKGLTEDLLTQECLPLEKCHHSWYLVLVIITGVLYVATFMYINKITKGLKSLLIPQFILDYLKYSNKTTISEVYKYMLRVIISQGCQVQYMTDDVIGTNAESEEKLLSTKGNVQFVCNGEMQSIVASDKDESEENVVPVLQKIVIFLRS